MPYKKKVTSGRRGRPPGTKNKPKIEGAEETVAVEESKPEPKVIEPRKVWPEGDPYNRDLYNSCKWGVHHRLVQSRQTGQAFCPDCYKVMY